MKSEFRYNNPVIRGFCPDPSICRANDKYYLVSSSFQYFPGIPVFESCDLINWKLVSHVLTRRSQLPLEGADSNSGIYAPTIRFYKGRFYLVTTNQNGCGNFLVWTDDIYGEWSEVVPIDRDGIDPSLYFEEDHVYFMSNHEEADGTNSIMQCEIDPYSGEILTKARCIWKGCGGRYLEAPHLYKKDGWYYLIAAEGGTEYGHMVVAARAREIYGPYEVPAPDSEYANPILTNRNLGGYPLQGAGHADLVQDVKGNWWMVLLAFRQKSRYCLHHYLGRDVCLVPVTFTSDNWLKAGENKTVRLEMTVADSEILNKQSFVNKQTFENTQPGREWVYLRNPITENYQFCFPHRMRIRGSEITLDDKKASPAFMGIRQQEMNGKVKVKLCLTAGEAGITLYMDQDHHYDLALVCNDRKVRIIKRRTIGDMQYIQQEQILPKETAQIWLEAEMTVEEYRFRAYIGDKSISYDMGSALTQYLSSETNGGFTGVMIGLYAVDTKDTFAEFSQFEYEMIR